MTEFEELSTLSGAPAIVHTLTRGTPPGWIGEHGRVDETMLARHAIAASNEPDIFVCGPTPFVEAVADHLLSLGHAEAKIRTERFGPTGEATLVMMHWFSTTMRPPARWGPC